jgi:hypothetical protein
MNEFESMKARLRLSADDRLLLDEVPMILTPRWFFVGIMKRVMSVAGPEAARRVYYDAGFDGAYSWGRKQIEKGLTGRAIMEQYLGSMTIRGWGRFEIVQFDEERGTGQFRFFHSAVALEWEKAEFETCLWAPGAIAGAIQVILDHRGIDLKARAIEKKCLAQGQPFCEFWAEPSGQARGA